MSETPPALTLQAVMARMMGLEKEVVELKAQLVKKDEELARKDEIIAALQRRLYGSKSERLDPDQVELDFSDDVMGTDRREIDCL
jgi:hypothetical protein